MSERIGWKGWKEIKETTERSRRREEMFWRIAATGILTLFCVIAILTTGCGDNRINPASATGPSTTGTTGTTGTTTTLDSSNDEDLKLVKQYNSDLAGGKATRWNNPTVTIHDSTGRITNLQSSLDKFNPTLLGKVILIIGGPGADIEIKQDDTLVTCGQVQLQHSDGIIDKMKISIGFVGGCGGAERIIIGFEHELGHSLGFFGETWDMFDLTSRVLKKLYSIEPGTIII